VGAVADEEMQAAVAAVEGAEKKAEAAKQRHQTALVNRAAAGSR
jgi:hypothetical protein